MTPAERVADAIRRRREQLGLSQQDVVQRAHDLGEKLSINNYRAYELGARPNPGLRVMSVISRALEWEADALNTVFSGAGDPVAQRHEDNTIAARLARIEARMAGDDVDISSLDAITVVLAKLHDDQFECLARAVAADGRFQTVT